MTPRKGHRLRITLPLLLGLGALLGALLAPGIGASGPEVVVYGAGPEAISAAVTAADAGLRVVMVGDDATVGGLITHGWLTTWDMSRGPEGQNLVAGFFGRLETMLGGHDSFSLSRAKSVMNTLAFHTPGLQTLLGMRLLSVSVRGGRVRSIVVSHGGRRLTLTAPYFIDASANADLASMAGARVEVGMNTVGLGHQTQAATLIFRVTGVNWTRVLETAQHASRRHPRSAWGYAAIDHTFRGPSPDIALRALNLARQGDGSVLVSGLWIFGVDPTNPASVQRGYRQASAALPQVVSFLDQHVPGFRHARLAGQAPSLYIRQSRQIQSLTMLHVTDELTNRLFHRRIALASYPIDVQATSPGQYGTVVGVPQVYGIPLGSLIPVGFTNLMVVGRSAGYGPLAAGSARTLPTGIAEGQAAADAVFTSLKLGVTLPALDHSRPDVARLQAKLTSQGAILDPGFAVRHRLPVPSWDQRAAAFLLRHFLLVGGYQNQFTPSSPPTAQWFWALLANTAQRMHSARVTTYPPPGPLTRSLALSMYAQVLAHRPVTSVRQLLAMGLITPSMARVLSAGGTFGAPQAYLLAAHLGRLLSTPPRIASAGTPQGRS